MPEMSEEVPVLETRGLGVGFVEASGRRVPVVEKLNVRLFQGRMTALVGESGCGKSISASALGQLLPNGMAMDEGAVFLDGKQLDAAAQRNLCGRTLAYIFQDPGECLNPVFTIENQLREALPGPIRARRSASRARLAELLKKTGLDDAARVLKSYPHELSGGMQQRVLLAMALAGNPRVLIADEPTTALDVTVQAQVLKLLQTLMREEQLAILLITHNLGIVAEYADWVHVMYAGRIVEEGAVGILRNPAHPYVRGLLRALPQLDFPQCGKCRLEGIEGRVPPLGGRGDRCRFLPRCSEAAEDCADWMPHPVAVDGSAHWVECRLQEAPAP